MAEPARSAAAIGAECALTHGFCYRPMGRRLTKMLLVTKTRKRMRRQLTRMTKRELTAALGKRYRSAAHGDKKSILDEFVEVTG